MIATTQEQEKEVRDRSREIVEGTLPDLNVRPKIVTPVSDLKQSELEAFKEQVNQSLENLVDWILQKDAETLEAKVVDLITSLHERIESIENKIAVRNSRCQPYERI